MKQGWEIKKLGEVCDILNGYAFKSEKYTSEGVRVLRITNVQKGYVVDDDPKFYPKDEMANLQQYVLKENDLLMSLTGNVGRVGLLQNEMLPAALNQRVACLRIKNEQLYINYLFHFLNSDKFENDAIFSASGIAQKNMSTEWLKNYTIPVPPREEQERIVEELDCLSGVIEKKREQLKQLDALAQSIFYQMFGDPITNEKGWEVKKLKDVAPQQEYKGDVPCVDGKYWLLNLDMVIPNTGEIIEKCYFDYDEIGNSTIIFNTDNVLYSKLRPYLNKVVIPNDIGYGTSELVPLKPHKDLLKRVFFASLLRSSYFVKYISGKVAGAKMPRVAMSEFREFAVILPPLALQQEFAEKIEAIEKQKELLKRSIKEVETLFDARMDYYFGDT